MSQAAEANTGRIIEGRYRIIGKIAEGGMATVYEALDQRLNRHVAVKIMHAQLAQGLHRAQFEERFRREATSAAAIANPHIVQVYDTGQVDGLDYLVMEYVHGVNLRYEMNQQGTFTLKETIRIVSEVLDGLASAHEAGVVHRDIKPENILINDRGHVEITDFGLARAASQATLSSTGMLLGTAAYLPPETIEQNLATPQGDLYAVGIVAWEMLTGSVPFVSDNPVTVVFKHVHEDVPPLSQVCPGIDPAASAFVSRLLARKQEDRPAEASAALAELKQDMAGLDLEAWRYRLMPADPTESADKPALAGTSVRAAAAEPGTTGGEDQQGDQADDLFADADEPTVAFDEGSLRSGTDEDPSATRRYAAASPSTKRQTAPMTAVQELGEMDSKPTHRRGRWVAIVVIVILALLAACGGGGAWWYFRGPGSYWKLPRPNDVSCQEGQPCSIKGADAAHYEQTLKVAGIPYTIKNDFSDTVPQGHVIDANPGQADDKVSKRGGEVSLIVSRGVKMATIPQDILVPSSQVGAHPLEALKQAGFSQINHQDANDEYSMDVPEGAALRVDPAPGSTTKHNETVSITLSKGRMPVTMPTVVGKNRDDASQALNELRLKTNYSEQWSDTIASGQIISASHNAGDFLHWGDQVDLVVSKGPQMVTLPDLRGKNENDASKALKDLGLEVNISAPLGDLSHTVRLQSPGPGEQVRLHGTDGKPTVITLTVV
ncbi:Serine/threonine protein kinase [Bifidobacterium actinocoloniiforme DSM 22766]|uniref:non-specific serine/threonine protein kinase n=1 Tax=Bifidobacterium actinocoloniiforme DSM 22766 TaxID=1437605 RepID=A0A086Z0T4_9BIFI|nr:PASTA domain-containing protein [Bifidobacterium actinocoloniiforme]AKV55332.1 serine/threonine protein kinase [Bifidobacterium actinocoloniiforme DSM 22766]KFI40134.1 Serine/threonine protein kinase [Bifidobacterium actinocoloniiforme DSM 22766]